MKGKIMYGMTEADRIEAVNTIITEGHDAGQNYKTIARTLNVKGIRTKKGNRWTKLAVLNRYSQLTRKGHTVRTVTTTPVTVTTPNTVPKMIAEIVTSNLRRETKLHILSTIV